MTKAWLLNTISSHWNHCITGPSGDDHPEEHHGEPWHGIPDTRNALNPTELKEGDLLIIRENGEGVRAIWTFAEARRVYDQSILPSNWRDHDGEFRDYRWIIYCRGEPVREFDHVLDENWNASPDIHPTALTGAAKKGRSVIEPYIDFLLDSDIPEEAKERLREASSNTHESGTTNGSGGQWSRDEFLVTLDLYLNESDYVADDSDPRIQEVASLIGRTPGSVVLRLANYRHLDPESTEGMSNVGKACREIWEEYYENDEELARDAQTARGNFRNSSKGSGSGESGSSGGKVKTGETTSERKGRTGQSDFRRVVRERYNDQCILCEISDTGLLQASHILEWSEHEEYRGDPANGLLLCYNHHRAFDLNMFTITGDYELVVRPGFEPSSDFLRRTLADRDGEQIELPTDPSSSEFFEEHNERLPWWPPTE